MLRATQPAAAPPPDGAVAEPLAADGIRALLAAGTTWLERNADAVNALNVFPVPDGDTGTNMVLTMRAAVDTAGKAKSATAGQAMRAAAQGAIMGARGNSGVILSQIIAGMAKGMDGAETCDGPTLARALAEGATTAYHAVTRPVEGTILTVARAAGETARAAAEAIQHGAPTCEHVLGESVAAARAAVERTPEQLEILRQAGVVDAGGEGYRVILEGMLLALRGQALPEAPVAPELGAATGDATGASAGLDASAFADQEWGYCTQFVIRGDALDLARVREELQSLAESALVVGDETMIRVHGHTDDPGRLLTYAAPLGRLQRISIEDMDAQHDEWLRTQAEAVSDAAGEPPLTEEIATVAVAPGEGFAEVFRSVGTAQVVAGGQTMNPSANDVLEAARRTRARTVIVLPNNGNVVMTAQQAAMVAEGGAQRLLVVPTKTVPQGVAAQLSFAADELPEENVAAMTEAAAAVRTVEITRATRSVTLDGVAVNGGDVLGLLDDRLVVAGKDLADVASRALEAAGTRSAELVTVYSGVDVPEVDASAFVEQLRRAYPKAEVQLVAGGQPHYDYVISVE